MRLPSNYFPIHWPPQFIPFYVFYTRGRTEDFELKHRGPAAPTIDVFIYNKITIKKKKLEDPILTLILMHRISRRIFSEYLISLKSKEQNLEIIDNKLDKYLENFEKAGKTGSINSARTRRARNPSLAIRIWKLWPIHQSPGGRGERKGR